MSVPILQPLNYKRAIVDGQGRPTPEFQQKWRRLYEIAGAIPDVTTAAAMSALLDLIASGEGTILRRGPETWAGLPTPGGTLKFLRADGSYAEPDVAVDEADIDLSDVLTNNVSSARHGFTPKLPNDATMYLDGTGQWSTPAGGGGGGGGGGNVATLGLVCTASKSYSGGTQPFTSPDWTSDFSDGAGLSFASNVVTVGSGVSFIEHTITASVASEQNTNIGVYIYKNGAAIAIAAGETPGSSGQNLWTVSTGPLPTEEGDTWQIGLYPGSSGSSTITPGDTPFAWHMAASGDSGGGGGGEHSADLYDPPSSSDFVLTNPAGTTPAPTLVDDDRLGMVLTSSPATSGDKLQTALTDCPAAAPWTLTARLRANVWPDSYRNAGLCVSDGTKYINFWTGETFGHISVAYYTDYDSYGSNLYTKGNIVYPVDFYMQIENDGTKLSFRFSYDGLNFFTVFSESVTAHLSSFAKFGPVVNPNHGSGIDGDTASVAVLYWKVE